MCVFDKVCVFARVRPLFFIYLFFLPNLLLVFPPLRVPAEVGEAQSTADLSLFHR